MTQIDLKITNEVSVDLLEAILRRKFPDKEVTRQNWGLNSPFLWIEMSYSIRVAVSIVHKPKKQMTRILVNDNLTIGGIFFSGWIGFWIFRKQHRKTIMNAVREGLRETTNVVFLN